MSDQTPDVIGEIVGFRAWRVVDWWVFGEQGLRLTSLFSDTIWPTDRWLVAECERSDEGIPHEGCGVRSSPCGIFAARDRSHLVRQRYTEGALAIGEVGLAGDVIRCARGWRAEKGRAVRLWVPHDRWQLAAPLAAAYRIPVGLSNILAERSSA